MAENQRDRDRLEKELEKQRADRAESDLQKRRECLLQLGIDPDSLS
ncbi:MAG: hypothetical protein J7647_13245 [Cyanobacteria bacterium SBLK]|nr:hypothetical protein [Cyanobacteria bacterium SBLK]